MENQKQPNAQELINHCKMDTLDFVKWYNNQISKLNKSEIN